jgi:hypothetical protein
MKNSKQIKQAYINYIINSIDTEYLTATEPKEQIKEIINDINKNHYARKTDSTYQNIENYIRGLGQCFNLKFTNHDIIELAKETGLYEKMMATKKHQRKNKELQKENIENQICNDYWHFITSYILEIARN